MPFSKSLNYKVLLVFAPILILTGVLGFVLPASLSVTSGEPPYDIFHIVFGILGLAILLTKKESYIRGFNIGFGLIDLYQAAAALMHLFPERIFKWTPVDTILHVLIGAALVAVGLYGLKAGKNLSKK